MPKDQMKSDKPVEETEVTGKENFPVTPNQAPEGEPDGKENFPVTDKRDEAKLPATTSPASKRMQYAGAGLENTNQDSFAIPFVTILQKGSPQVDEDSGNRIEGAKAGMIFNTVTGKMYDGKEGISIIPAAFRQVFLKWRPRGADGAGFGGEYPTERIAEMRARGEVVEFEGRLYTPNTDGTPPNPKRNDRYADTRNHYIIVVEPDGSYQQALLSLTSTQVRKSKNLLAALAAVKRRSHDGKMVTPATFDNLVRMTTVPESNDQGTWYGVKFEVIGPVPENRDDLFEAALEFNQLVKKDDVKVKYVDDMDDGGGRGGSDSGGF
jgi:hypothetical protein